MTGEILSGELQILYRLTWQHHVENLSDLDLFRPHNQALLIQAQFFKTERVNPHRS